MSHATRRLSATLAVALCAAAAGCALQDGRRTARIAAVYKISQPTVVPVRFLQEVDTATGPRKGRITCTGILVSPEGLVMTSGSYFMDELPKNAFSNFQVRTDRVVWHKARFLGKDEDMNVAFLKIEGDLSFPYLDFTRSKAPRPGETILSLSLMPERFGYAPTFSTGRVNALLEEPRSLYGLTREGVNRPGAPVLTLDGKILGILNVFPAAGPGGNRGGANVVLVEPAANLLPLIASPPGDADRASKGWLGIVMDHLGPDKAEYWGIPDPRGVIVTAVLPGSPASRAGIELDDVITHVDGKRIEVRRQKDLEAFRATMRGLGAGTTVRFSVLRNKKEERTLIADLTTAPPPESEVAWHRDKKLGMTVRDVSYLYAIANRLDPEKKGVLVTNVIAAGPAGLAGLRRGDIVRRVNTVTVRDINDLQRAVKAAQLARDKEVLLLVQRDNDTALVNIRMEW